MRRAVWRCSLPVVVAVLAACGGGGSTVVRPPLSTTPASSGPPSTGPTTSVAPTTAQPGGQRITVTPSTALVSGQHVAVTGSGFSPGEALVVTECAAKGTGTGPGDCNLDGIVMTSSDASGRVQAELEVVIGPFGSGHVVCSAAQACLVSVTQATPSPTEEADTPISFR